MSNGRILRDDSIKKIPPPAQKKPTFDDWFAKYVISPYSKYLVAWNLVMTLFYLVAIFQDSMTIAFHLHPLLIPTFCKS